MLLKGLVGDVFHGWKFSSTSNNVVDDVLLSDANH